MPPRALVLTRRLLHPTGRRPGAPALTLLAWVWAASLQAAPVLPMSDASGLNPYLAGSTPAPADQLPPEVLALLSSGQSQALRQRGLALKQRLDAKPNDAYLMHALATVMFHEGAVKEAKALWQASSKRDPNLPSAELMAALQVLYVQLATGKTAAAQAQLAAIEKRHAADPHLHLARAEQAMRGGNLKAAEDAYRRAYQLGGKLWVTSLNLARFLDLAGSDAAGAARLYQAAVTLAPQRPEPLDHLARWQLKQNQADAAMASLRKARQLDPGWPLPEWRMAELCNAMGRFDQAHRWYQAALATQPPKADALAMRAALGEVLVRLQRPADARREMESVLKERQMPSLVFALGMLDEADGKFDAAETRYRQALQLGPGNPLAANNLAMLLIKTRKRPSEALALAVQARQAMPNHPNIEGTWGCAMVENRQAQAAVAVLRAVARAQGDVDAWAHYCLGKALAEQHENAEAATHLRKVLQLDPTFLRRDEVASLLARLA
jgi:Flp pilus assembly protein TadD